MLLTDCIAGAEELYIAAGEWTLAVNMLRSNNMWEQAYKVGSQEIFITFHPVFQIKILIFLPI